METGKNGAGNIPGPVHHYDAALSTIARDVRRYMI
jgi:hypothetical protein